MDDSGLIYLIDRVRESRALLPYALRMALQFHCTVYGAVYLSVAVDENGSLVTADKRLLLSFAQTPLARHLLWVEDALRASMGELRMGIGWRFASGGEVI